MRTTQLLVISLIASALAACGGSGPSPASSVAANRASAASLPANASAEQVAAHMRGNVHCPADIPAAPAGTPVDDLVGVRPGLTYEQAANAVMCSNPLLVVTPETGRGFDIQTYGQTIRQGFSARLAEARVQKTGQQMLHDAQQEFMDREMNATRHDMQPGQTKWFVGTMGMPGQERVISAAREEWFAKGKNPTVESVTEALIKKYGTPTQKADEYGDRNLRWAYDPRGQQLTEAAWRHHSCGASADPDVGMNVSADCGAAVHAIIFTMHDNTALSRFLQVGVVDQAAGYKLLTDTENGLKAMDAARRAKQVKAAARNAVAPQL